MEPMEVKPTELETESATFDFAETLHTLYADFQTCDEIVSEAIATRLKELLTHTEENLNTEEYMQVMYMEGKKYEQQESKEGKNAARFCAMRMLYIRECYENPKRKRPRFLDMIPYTIDENMNEFIDKYTDFLEDTYKYIGHRLLLITAGLIVVIFLIFAFVLQIHVIMALLEALLIGSLNYILQQRRLPAMFQKNQTTAIEHYVEEDVLEFDRPVRYS